MKYTVWGILSVIIYYLCMVTEGGETYWVIILKV